jgi:hypothetical protein
MIPGPAVLGPPNFICGWPVPKKTQHTATYMNIRRHETAKTH